MSICPKISVKLGCWDSQDRIEIFKKYLFISATTYNHSISLWNNDSLYENVTFRINRVILC